MRETDIAYMAGIMDGEGCIVIGRKKIGKYIEYRVEAKVGNSNKPMLLFLQHLLGGQIYKNPKRKSHHKQVWYWYATGSQCVDTLRVVLPYLKIKRAEAELAITFWEDNAIVKGKRLLPEEKERLEKVRDAYYVEMRGLKHAPHLFRQPPKMAEILN